MFYRKVVQVVRVSQKTQCEYQEEINLVVERSETTQEVERVDYGGRGRLDDPVGGSFRGCLDLCRPTVRATSRQCEQAIRRPFVSQREKILSKKFFQIILRRIASEGSRLLYSNFYY